MIHTRCDEIDREYDRIRRVQGALRKKIRFILR